MLRAKFPSKPAVTLLLLTQLLFTSLLSAQEASLAPAATLTVPAGTPVQLRLNQTVSSLHAHIGDPLKFMVVKDVNIDGLTVIPAGSVASGSVIGVKGKRFFGMGGHVVFSLDSVALVNGDRVTLQARQEVKGSSRTRIMAAGMVAAAIIFWPVTPVFLLSRGCDSTALKGTEVTSHIGENVVLQSANLPKARDGMGELKEVMSFVPPRVLTGEGREGDMVNLVFVGQKDDLQRAFQRAGWINVDRWRPVMAWHLLQHRTHDSTLPMATFYMFGRSQDYSYALPDPTAIVSNRHHLRIWKTDYELNGNPVWVGAATHDVAIEMWKRGRVINHRIDPQVDAERDFIGTDLTATHLVDNQKYVNGFSPVYEAETASGETYYSDSKILFLDLHGPQNSKAELRAATSAPLTETLAPKVAITSAAQSPIR